MKHLTIASLVLAGCIAEVPGGTDPMIDEPALEEIEAGSETTTIAATTKKQLAYFVVPHPDDEWEAWSLIEGAADNYSVFVLMTKGEETAGCTADGMAWYQGGLGEYVFGNPWQGRYRSSCTDARIASYHLFLDRMAQVDPTLPYQPPYVGRFCFGGTPGDGAPPTRNDNGIVKPANCAQVWASDKGARVIFDLGDNDLRAAEVVWAMRAVRANRAALTIPDLPVHEVVAAAFYNATAPGSGVKAYADCDYYGHGDHHAIHAAVWNTKFAAVPHYGRACDSDPDVVATGGRVDYVDLATNRAAFEMDGAGRRVGAHVVAYGWLNPTVYESCFAGCGFSRKQSFWKR